MGERETDIGLDGLIVCGKNLSATGKADVSRVEQGGRKGYSTRASSSA